MRSIQPMKDQADRIQSIRYRHEMNVVCHETVSKKTHAVVPATVSQQLQVIDAVGFISKYIQTPGAPLGDMHGHSRHDNARSSRHCVSGMCTARNFLGAERKGTAMMSSMKPCGKEELSLRPRNYRVLASGILSLTQAALWSEKSIVTTPAAIESRPLGKIQ